MMWAFAGGVVVGVVLTLVAAAGLIVAEVLRGRW
jgi:hypothetical protein